MSVRLRTLRTPPAAPGGLGFYQRALRDSTGNAGAERREHGRVHKRVQRRHSIVPHWDLQQAVGNTMCAKKEPICACQLRYCATLFAQIGLNNEK